MVSSQLGKYIYIAVGVYLGISPGHVRDLNLHGARLVEQVAQKTEIC